MYLVEAAKPRKVTVSTATRLITLLPVRVRDLTLPALCLPAHVWHMTSLTTSDTRSSKLAHFLLEGPRHCINVQD